VLLPCQPGRDLYGTRCDEWLTPDEATGGTCRSLRDTKLLPELSGIPARVAAKSFARLPFAFTLILSCDPITHPQIEPDLNAALALRLSLRPSSAWYFMLPPSPASTLLFGALMGFLWMGVGPLVAGAVAEMFGLQWQAMIQGLAFMSHQIGSFLGAYGGGLLYDSFGSYTMAWRIGVALGLAGGIVQIAFALIRPTRPPLVAAA